MVILNSQHHLQHLPSFGSSILHSSSDETSSSTSSDDESSSTNATDEDEGVSQADHFGDNITIANIKKQHSAASSVCRPVKKTRRNSKAKEHTIVVGLKSIILTIFLLGISFWAGWHHTLKHQHHQHTTSNGNVDPDLRLHTPQARLIQRIHAETLVHPSMITHNAGPGHVALFLQQQEIATLAFDLENSDHGSSWVCAVLEEISKYSDVEEVTLLLPDDSNISDDSKYNKHTLDNDDVALMNVEQGAICGMHSRDWTLRVEHYSEQGGLDCHLDTMERESLFDIVFWLQPFQSINLQWATGDGTMETKTNKTEQQRAFLNDAKISKLAKSLSKCKMNEGGILAAPLSSAPVSLARYNTNPMLAKLQIDFINAIGGGSSSLVSTDTASPVTSSFIENHIYEESQFEGLQQEQAYVLFCKDMSCREHRVAEPEYIQWLMRKRLRHRIVKDMDSALHTFGAVSYARQARPSKIWESIYCADHKHQDQCQFLNGFDPLTRNVVKSQVEVKPSSLGPAVGRGLFSREDIHAGSFMLLEDMAQYIVCTPRVASQVDTMYYYFFPEEKDDDSDEEACHDDDRVHEPSWLTIANQRKSELRSVYNYLEGYGFSDESYGVGGIIVDCGYTMFSNHGCNRTEHLGDLARYNNAVYGSDLPRESEADIDLSSLLSPHVNITPKEAGAMAHTQMDLFDMTNPDGTLFNPLMDRRFGRELSSEGVIHDISSGMEIFSNYISYGGGNEDDWVENALQLRAECRGDAIGIIVQVESPAFE